MSSVSPALQNGATGNSHRNLKGVRELIRQDERLVFSLSTDDELPIEASAHTGNRPIIRLHLDHGAPLSLPTAVSLGDTDSVKFWLRRESSLANERGAHDFPVMWYSMLGRGGPEMAELLVQLGVEVDQESMGTTTLHWCARRGDQDLAKWLLDNGADPEALGFKWNRKGETPLQVAGDDAEMIALLKQAGARV